MNARPLARVASVKARWHGAKVKKTMEMARCMLNKRVELRFVDAIGRKRGNQLFIGGRKVTL
jgi:hypothetical protein